MKMGMSSLQKKIYGAHCHVPKIDFILSYTYHLSIFYNSIFFHVSNILSIFTTIEISLFVLTIYSFSKILVATKI